MTKQIGKLTTTPAPGDPIVSPWYQQIATYARHIFATKVELDAQWSDAPDGAHAWVTGENLEYERIAGSWQSKASWAAAWGQLTATDLLGADVLLPAGEAVIFSVFKGITKNRRYRLRAQLAFWTGGVAGPILDAFIYDEAARVYGTAARWSLGTLPGGSSANGLHIVEYDYVGPRTGSMQFVVRASSSPAGVYITASATQFTVTDVGSATPTP